MNQTTREISRLANVNIEQAVRIHDRIASDWLLDFSECTERQLATVIRNLVAKWNTPEECPAHNGAFDCTPFCTLCEGAQEYQKESPL